jgi:uncharacterized protein (DUF885 family)
LYERGFADSPEDRIGFLVWRSHRCARIIFSLSFHLGWMTPGECVDFLVENVGFERMGAEGEVRRSFGGAYPPLYQAAYMLGGLQFRELHRKLVKEGDMRDREFPDQRIALYASVGTRNRFDQVSRGGGHRGSRVARWRKIAADPASRAGDR